MQKDVCVYIYIEIDRHRFQRFGLRVLGLALGSRMQGLGLMFCAHGV